MDNDQKYFFLAYHITPIYPEDSFVTTFVTIDNPDLIGIKLMHDKFNLHEIKPTQLVEITKTEYDRLKKEAYDITDKIKNSKNPAEREKYSKFILISNFEPDYINILPDRDRHID